MQVRRLERDIYVLQRPDALHQPVEPNVLVIVNDHDVVVIGPGGVPPSPDTVIRLIRSITDKPVSVLVNTHRHGGRVPGLQTWGEAFPGLRVIGRATSGPAAAGDLVLRRGAREIHIRHLGSAAEGAVVVWLPNERVLVGGAAIPDGYDGSDFSLRVPAYGEVQAGGAELRLTPPVPAQ